MSSSANETNLLDLEPALDTFYADVVAGLSQSPRSLPCKYFYDERGSKLFEEICDLPEYYLTRTELAIMNDAADEMAEEIGKGVMLVEFGSGSSVKTRILLDHLRQPTAYVPVDISRDHLQQNADELNARHPEIEILPVCADFTDDIILPPSEVQPNHIAVYFPGSTIGNFTPDEAQTVLARIAELCESGGGLLIGIDLQKDVGQLEMAYDDSDGVTAAFNMNLLRRINDELDGNIRLENFQHEARYNESLHRIEMHLVSLEDQTIEVGDASFGFTAGETIHTESSHKYTIDGFARLAENVGFQIRRHWTDDAHRFAVLYLEVA